MIYLCVVHGLVGLVVYVQCKLPLMSVADQIIHASVGWVVVSLLVSTQLNPECQEAKQKQNSNEFNERPVCGPKWIDRASLRAFSCRKS